MKKIILSVATLSAALAQAQVGINEEKPKATLDISVKKDNIDNESQEGLLIPRVTKEKALKMANNAATPPEESALIYVNNMTLTGTADATVEDITEKGYYFWNGTKWVKSSGSDKLPWVYNTSGNVELNYSSSVIEDKYTEKQHFVRDKGFSSFQGYNRLGDVNKKQEQYLWGFRSNYAREAKVMKLSNLPNISSIDIPHFTANWQIIDPDTPSNVVTIYANKGVTAIDGDNANDYNRISYVHFAAEHHGTGRVEELTGANLQAHLLPNSKADQVIGSKPFAVNYSNYPVSKLIGSILHASHQGNGNVERVFGGALLAQKASTTGNVEELVAADVNVMITDGASYSGNVTNAIGVMIRQSIPSGTGLIENNYGIHIGDIVEGTNKYAIYTGLGDVRFGQFKDASASTQRLLAVDSDGKLVVGNTTNFTSLWENTTNAVKLKSVSNGTPRTVQNSFVVDDLGYVGMGVEVPTRNLHIKAKDGENAEILLERYSDDVSGANLVLVKNNGARGNVAPVTVGQSLGRYRTGGSVNNTDFDGFASSIETIAAAAPVAGKVPTNMFIRLTKDTGDRNTVLSMIGNNGNVGVGTNTPTEKLDVNGKIKTSSLAGSGERIVTANTDGVLQTSTTSLADLESLWKKESTSNRIVLKENSAGAPRTSASGTGRNDVTISDDGKITARGFVGYNGATIFPDYVFEKYYTGESTIKADYNFHNLASVESFIKTNGHLPGYTSAKEIAEKGLIDISATQLTNVEKIEELYLHTIEQQKQIEELKALVRGIK